MNDNNFSGHDYHSIVKSDQSKSYLKKKTFFEHDEQVSLESRSQIKALEVKGPEEADIFLLDDKPSNKSCKDRWFSPINAGSVRASILTIISSMIGVGF